jgi:hypothetical protein
MWLYPLYFVKLVSMHIPGVVLDVLFEYLLAMHALCLHYTTSEKE